jgi:hypothetical protein
LKKEKFEVELSQYENKIKEILFGENKSKLVKSYDTISHSKVFLDQIMNENDPLFFTKKFYNQSESSIESLFIIRLVNLTIIKLKFSLFFI